MSTATLGNPAFRPSLAKTMRSWPDTDFMVEQAMGWTVAQVPWWAVALLGEPSGVIPGTPEWRVRERMQQGRRPFTARSQDWWCAWYRVVVMARELEERTDLARWRNRAWSELDHTDLFDKGGGVTHAVRGAALHSIRAFAQFIDLRDDEGQVFEFEDFHVQTVRAMRCYPEPSVILLPFGHGKSALNSLVVPLMDWAEFPDASEGRIYWSNSHHRKWTGRLMQVVEGNEALHQLFPWVNKPIKGDPCYGIWSGDGFSIKGRRTRDRSFEPLTASTYSTGNRYHRIGNDDWVQTGNATSIPTQDRLFEYLRSGPLTMPMPVRRGSRYGTAWSKVYHCGTLFDPNDVNYRAWQHFKAQGWRCVRFDIYPHEDSREKGEVLWPTKRPFSYVQDLEQQLGRRVFDMRCRNRVALGGKYIFTPQDVDAAMTDSLAFGRAPAGATLMIGFDPASSKKGRRLAHPALVVYGEKTETSPIGQRPVLLQDGMRPMVTSTTHHVVEWHRLTGSSMPEQCQALIDVARRQQAPVAVEDNQTQIAYAELIRVMAPDVRVITHTTTENRRDPLQGVDQFQPLFENRSIFIHTGGAERPHINELRSELVHWPRSRTTDLVMAMWIARFQLRLHEEIYRTRSVRSPALPGYAHFGGRRTLRLVKPA